MKDYDVIEVAGQGKVKLRRPKDIMTEQMVEESWEALGESEMRDML